MSYTDPPLGPWTEQEIDEFLEAALWEWKKVDKVPLPVFVEGQAKGVMKLENGIVYHKVKRKHWGEGLNLDVL